MDHLQHVEFGNSNNKPLIFLPALDLSPKVYSAVFDKLSSQRWIISPHLYSIKNIPSSWNASLEMTKLSLDDKGLAGEDVAGHSFGGSMAMYLGSSNRLALNPLVGISGSPWNFMPKAMKLSLEGLLLSGEVSSKHHVLSTHPGFARDVMCNFAKVYDLVDSFKSLDYNGCSGAKVVFGANDVYSSPKDLSDFRAKGIEVTEVTGLTHDRPIYYPTIASHDIKNYFDR